MVHFIKLDNHCKHRNHHNTPKLFPPVFEKQVMSKLCHYVELREIFFKPYANDRLTSKQLGKLSHTLMIQ